MVHPFFIVTGLSGSGKTTALKAFEDWGCEVIDNLPVSLCRSVIEHKMRSGPIALGIDVRTRDFEPNFFIKEIQKLKQDYKITILFFEAELHVVCLRYRETRRLHPLGIQDNLEELILKEKALLKKVRENADQIINTSEFSPPEIRRYLQEIISIKRPPLTIHILSFAFGRGALYQADMVFDMRFLTNPYYQKELRFLTGKASSIQEYLNKDEYFQKFIVHLQELLISVILPQFQKEGKGETVIAFGCTGGRHRSVFTAETVSKILREQGYSVRLYHRELK